MLRMVARWLLPGSIYDWGRGLAHRRRQGRYQRLPGVSEAAFRRLLAEDLRLASGQVVFVHLSLAGLRLEFPFYRVLSLLREAVGEEGTLLFPSTQLKERPETWLARGEVFDVRATPTTMGVIPEFARRQQGACRSLHPTHSVAALGPLAEELTGTHPDSPYPCGESSPYYKAALASGRIIGLGVDPSVLTFVHCVEDLWRERFPVETRSSCLYQGRVLDLAGRERVVPTLVAHPRIRWREIPRYVQRHVPPWICAVHRRHGAWFYAAEAGPLLRRMEELAGQGITIYSRLIYRGSPADRPLSWLARWLG